MKKIVSPLWDDTKIRKIQNGDGFSMDKNSVYKTNSFYWDTKRNDFLGAIVLPMYGAFVSEEKCRLFGDVSGKKMFPKRGLKGGIDRIFSAHAAREKGGCTPEFLPGPPPAEIRDVIGNHVTWYTYGIKGTGWKLYCSLISCRIYFLFLLNSSVYLASSVFSSAMDRLKWQGKSATILPGRLDMTRIRVPKSSASSTS